jgi:hypothetical protein
MGIRDRLRILLYGPDPEPGEIFERRGGDPFSSSGVVLIGDVRDGWVKFRYVWNSSRVRSLCHTLPISELYAKGYKRRVVEREEDGGA